MTCALIPAAAAQAQIDLPYQMPPPEIAALVDAPQTPSVFLSPTGLLMAELEQPGLPGIDQVAQPELRIAGLRINPRTNGPSRARYSNGISIMRLSDKRTESVTGLPPDAKIDDVEWSPDGSWLAFTITRTGSVELWGVDTRDGRARRLTSMALNAAFGKPYEWTSDSKTLLVRVIPPGRGETPLDPIVPTGPSIQENIGEKRPARTYQDLLGNPHDEDLFDYYGTCHLVRVGIDGATEPIGTSGIIMSASPSPDGSYILVESIHHPYSYTVPFSRFPRTIEVWDKDGNSVEQVADLPLADNVPIPFGSVPTGPRDVSWRQDADATLYWTEALDGGDAGKEAAQRDQVYMLEAPFKDDPVRLVTLAFRYAGMSWCNDDLALVSEGWWSTRTRRVWAVQPGSPAGAPRLLLDYSFEDRYNDPGRPMMVETGRGTTVLASPDDGKTIFLSGAGASPEGDRPFLDEYDVTTGRTKRLFRSEAPYYELASEMLDVGKREVLTRRESVTEVPNYFDRNLSSGEARRLTEFPDPTPQLRNVHKEMIRYKRADGVDLTATLYLPAGYDAQADGPLPMLMWAYPQEYKSADAAGQVTDSPYRFVRIGPHSPLYWLLHGYAILDDPSLPIIGEGDEEPNDTYVQQLVAGAKAAVDEVVRRGVARPGHIAIGGHSYGAFMAANLLAHSDLFAAGIARSGAYNRTLTPFGFQAEERTFWQAPEVYFAMSPFMHAESINEPLLLIHGEADNNSGTFPIQSERLFEALKGLGGTVRLVMLPDESHGYRARESVMHMLFEMTQWLDTYVGGTKPEPKTEARQESLGH